jgi:hypothetical protein
MAFLFANIRDPSLPVRGASLHTRTSQTRVSQFGWQMFETQEQLGALTMSFRNRFPYASLQLKLIPMLSQHSCSQSWSMKNRSFSTAFILDCSVPQEAFVATAILVKVATLDPMRPKETDVHIGTF